MFGHSTQYRVFGNVRQEALSKCCWLETTDDITTNPETEIPSTGVGLTLSY